MYTNTDNMYSLHEHGLSNKEVMVYLNYCYEIFTMKLTIKTEIKKCCRLFLLSYDNLATLFSEKI